MYAFDVAVSNSERLCWALIRHTARWPELAVSCLPPWSTRRAKAAIAVGRPSGCCRPTSGARDPINQSLKPTFNQIEPRSLHPADHRPGQVLPGTKSGSIIFRSETEQVSVTADRRAHAG